VAGTLLAAPGVRALLLDEAATAVVVRRIDGADDPSLPRNSDALVLEFRTRSGDLVRVQRLVPADHDVHLPGDTFPVVYAPGRPQDAHLETFRARWTLGAGLLLAGATMVAAQRHRHRRPSAARA
jgi:hypothetical protein